MYTAPFRHPLPHHTPCFLIVSLGLGFGTRNPTPLINDASWSPFQFLASFSIRSPSSTFLTSLTTTPNSVCELISISVFDLIIAYPEFTRRRIMREDHTTSLGFQPHCPLPLFYKGKPGGKRIDALTTQRRQLSRKPGVISDIYLGMLFQGAKR